ncbi:hypothetical protein PLESHI_09213, partial [Plesiomonas shigelloides 302-73]
GRKIHVVNAHFKMSLLELLVIKEPDVWKAIHVCIPNTQANYTLSINFTYNTKQYIVLNDS